MNLTVAALAYPTVLGPVFPLRPSGKEPNGRLAPHGVNDASSDAATIRRWWTEAPESNIGLACGRGWFVVDVDVRNGGSDTLLSLEEANGPLTRTVTSQTGGGGYHYLYRLPEGVKLRGSLGTGIDLKGPGGYVVAPPSLHPSGKRYTWHPELHPMKVIIAEAPGWLLDIATTRAGRDVGPAVGIAAQAFLARAFDIAGWLGGDLPGGAVAVRCPWLHEHSDGRGDGGDSSTVILPPTPERPLGSFRCSHGHCETRGTVAALHALPSMAVALLAHDDPGGFTLAARLMTLRGAA